MNTANKSIKSKVIKEASDSQYFFDFSRILFIVNDCKMEELQNVADIFFNTKMKNIKCIPSPFPKKSELNNVKKI